MIRSAASKALGLGRATVAPVVVAVMLVVVFGAAPASAHGGYKGLLHLGHNNAIAKVTTLVGKVATGEALVVKNPSGGSALGLQVNAGQAPLTVNADAGKATNLSADKLDGQDSTEFAAKAEAPGFDAHTVTTSTTLSTAPTDIATVAVTAPADGFVILTGNGVFRASHTNGQNTHLRAYLGTAQTFSINDLTLQTVPASAPFGEYSVPFSITRVFPVTAGENTFRMAADSSSGTSSTGTIVRHNLTGVFVKNQL